MFVSCQPNGMAESRHMLFNYFHYTPWINFKIKKYREMWGKPNYRKFWLIGERGACSAKPGPKDAFVC